MSPICRACLQGIINSDFVFLSDTVESVQIKTKLLTCVPEMAVDLFDNSILCASCNGYLQSAYDFKTRCLLTEQRIQALQLNDKKQSLEEICWKMNRPHLANPSNVTKELDDLSSLLDGVIQNQLQVLHKPDEIEGTETKNDRLDVKKNTLDIKNEAISEEDDIPLDNELENDFYEDGVQDEEPDLSSIINRKAFVQIAKLPDNLVYSLLSRNIKKPISNVFKCNKCDYSSNLKKYLLKHQSRMHSNKTPFACHLCDFKGRVKRSLKRHMKIHSLKCDLCDYKPKRKDHLERHLLTHNLHRAKPFGCKICNYKSPDKTGLRRHMRIHEKPHVCNVCEKRFQSKTFLIEHISIHTGEKPFACHICPFKTIYKTGLAAHIKRHTINYFSCNICKLRTASKYYLKRHMLIHTREKPFVCNVCEHRTASKERSLEHIRIHTGEKPYSCALCSLKFSNRTNLRRHKLLHQKRENLTDKLTCNICGYLSVSEFILNAHTKNHGLKNISVCPTCKYIGTSKGVLETHIAVHPKQSESSTVS